MSKPHIFRLPFLTFVVGMSTGIVLEAAAVSAYAGITRGAGEMARGFSLAPHETPDTLGPLSPIEPMASFEIANNDKDRTESKRRSGPPPTEVRGRQQPMEVIRRSATPIPRLSNRSRRNRNGYGGRSYYSGRHHYYHGHRHHSHCGHDYYWDYGDRYESRTLGRSCIYGPKGEVIYKPADIICAPDESAVPAAAPAPRPAPAQRPPAPSKTNR